MHSLTSITVAVLLFPAMSDTEASGIRASAALALESFRQEHGPSWSVIADVDTGHASMLYGGRARLEGAAHTDADFASLALAAIAHTVGIHGVDPSTLEVDEVVFLPLHDAGTTDKMTVRLVQSVGGVPVTGGSVNVLLDRDGRLLSIDSQALPGVHFLRTTPALTSSEAIALTSAIFEAETGLRATRLSEPELRVEQTPGAGSRRGVLVWDVEATWEAAGAFPEGYRYGIDARTGRQVARVPLVHTLNIRGNVVSKVTPGALPDRPTNPEVVEPMPFILVSHGQHETFTDELGNFDLHGISAPATIIVSYEGRYANVVSFGGLRHTVQFDVTNDDGNMVEMNTLALERDTAEANVYDWIHRLRAWTKSVNPDDDHMDGFFRAFPNQPNGCDSFYNGTSIGFSVDTGTCPNSAYSSVVVHEMGHWLNDLYGSGNNLDGFGEGAADAYAMFLLDDPIVGRDFMLGSPIRDGNNIRQLCQDGTTACHGTDPHVRGEVLMGALWKVRRNLKNKHGDALGGHRADVLFNSWMNAYDANSICPVIENHWLTLDDNNGNLADGTPNFAEIDGAFREQGFPGHVITDPPSYLHRDKPQGGPGR